MEVKEAIRGRRSIRKYKDLQIPDDVMEDLLDSMRLAPSSSNEQRWNVVVVTDADLKQKLAAASGNQKFVAECAAYLVGVIDAGDYFRTVDLTIALDHLTLRAVELGLGTCWIGDFEPDHVAKMLGIPKNKEIPICMTLGYPAQSPGARKRKKLTELFHLDNWGSLWK
jgi:nitroreductase